MHWGPGAHPSPAAPGGPHSRALPADCWGGCAGVEAAAAYEHSTQGEEVCPSSVWKDN